MAPVKAAVKKSEKNNNGKDEIRPAPSKDKKLSVRVNAVVVLCSIRLLRLQFLIEPGCGIAHHIRRDEVAEAVVDDGLSLYIAVLSQLFKIKFLSGSIDDIVGSAAKRQERTAAKAVHMLIGIHGGKLHL